MKQWILWAIAGWLECQDECQGYEEDGALYPATFEAAKDFFINYPLALAEYERAFSHFQVDAAGYNHAVKILETLEKPGWIKKEFDQDEEYKERLKKHLQCMLDTIQCPECINPLNYRHPMSRRTVDFINESRERQGIEPLKYCTYVAKGDEGYYYTGEDREGIQKQLDDLVS